MACTGPRADVCSSSSIPSTTSSSSLKKASRRLTRNGMSLKRISVSSLTEARAATKSALRAGKYRVQETSRDLWSRTKVPLAQGKRKSKELVDLSADLISSLSVRVQKKLQHGRQQEHSFSPHLDASESDHEYFWDSDFSDSSFSESSGDEAAEVDLNAECSRDYHPHETGNDESDCEVQVEDEVAGRCLGSEQAVQCKSMRKIGDEDHYRPPPPPPLATACHVPSIQQIKEQLLKIQLNARKRQSVPNVLSGLRSLDRVQSTPSLPVVPTTISRERRHVPAPSVSENEPKKSPLPSCNASLKGRVQRPREQPPPPPPPPPLPRTQPPSLLSSTSSLNSAPLSLSSASSSGSSASSSQPHSPSLCQSSWKGEKEDGRQERGARKHNDVRRIVKREESAGDSSRPDGSEWEFNDGRRSGDLQTRTDTSGVSEADAEDEQEDDTDTESSYEVPHDSCPWFRPDLTRSQAEQLLLSLDAENEGFFVVRPGGSAQYPYSLSLLHEAHVCHLNIRSVSGSGSCYSLGKGDSGRVFSSLKNLVLYYANKPLILVSSKSKPESNQNNNRLHDLPLEPRKFVRLSLTPSKG